MTLRASLYGTLAMVVLASVGTTRVRAAAPPVPDNQAKDQSAGSFL